MKLYDFAKAPSPRMVRIFMAEKGVEMETIQVDLMTAEQMKPDFAAKNPWLTVPVIELDDGTCISESQRLQPLSGGSPSGAAATWAATPRKKPSSRCGTTTCSWRVSWPAPKPCATPPRR